MSYIGQVIGRPSAMYCKGDWMISSPSAMYCKGDWMISSPSAIYCKVSKMIESVFQKEENLSPLNFPSLFSLTDDSK
ncbi:hypothetical protein CEXT_61251 [Caerostris extrusa]|uniref:Uncharacterized protein n=1 Tax=Caerostris extrusa TaxID=172846 RepID=A0AAV4V4Y2_CAEEX|nr:hypothetical protein CEXT_61251 [Caerostris extrusa]